MKRNPYKVTETVLCTVMVLIMLGTVFGVVHFTNSWRGFGLCVGIVLLIVLLMCFLGWWTHQRDMWDIVHNKPGER